MFLYKKVRVFVVLLVDRFLEVYLAEITYRQFFD